MDLFYLFLQGKDHLNVMQRDVVKNLQEMKN